MDPQASQSASQALERKLNPISPLSLGHNFFIITYTRSMLAGVAGAAAGILGLQGIAGFVFYIFASAFMSLLLSATAGFKPDRFFVNGWTAVLTGEVTGSMFSYLLFWTLVYGLVHVYQD
ncbi:Rab5-interacting protein-domain-containing protein [Zopfochytrium polystomum]|nr:Rab5-interacting protein-domain-containing protein [Zopfochytrium polystomum]